MAVTTADVLKIALDMAGFSETPADSAIYFPGENIRRIIIGIDMEAPELLLAKQEGFDLVISHHPKGGGALLRFADVLSRHVEFMTAHGVPEPVARDAVGELIYDARCQAQAANYDRAPSMARRLQIPYMNIHLPLDEIGRKRMVAVVDSLDPAATVKELLGAFEHRLPECRAAATEIELRVGLASHPIGHAAVIHAAGTNGGIPVARALYNHGVDTVIYIHCSGPDSRRLNQDFHDQGRNLIVIGHMTGDSLGINPFAEELISRGLDVTCMSGIIRNENLQIP